MRPLRNTERVLKNESVDRILEKEKSLGDDIKINDIMDEVAGVYPKIMTDGDMDAGAWSCGMVAGLIHDVPSCKELIDAMMKEADEIITSPVAICRLNSSKINNQTGAIEPPFFVHARADFTALRY
jgi:nitronate monooxygenase